MKLWLTRWKSVFRLFGVRSWLVAAGGGIAALVLIGITSAIIDNPFFLRMTPTRTQDYVIWALTGLLAGLIAGTFTLPVQRVAFHQQLEDVPLTLRELFIRVHTRTRRALLMVLDQ